MLAGYVLGSLAAFEIDGNDPSLGLALIAEARRQIGDTPHPTPQAWLDVIEALSFAAIGKAADADGALLRAWKAIDKGSESAPVPWPWVFSFDQPKLACYQALVAVRLNRPAEALAAFADSLSAAQPAPKQRATIMLDVATAARQDGMQQKDNERIDESFRPTSDALGIGIAYSSERVIEKARCFRRNYTGPSTSHVRTFDEQLRSTLADGADQIFARAVIDLGGTIEVILPAEQYRSGLPAEAHAEYDDLLTRAAAVHRLPFVESTSESHMAASELMVDESDELYAVWDGKPARAYGGTADVVTYARDHSTPVEVIWPVGATRD